MDGQEGALRLPVQGFLRLYRLLPRGPPGRRRAGLRTALDFLARGWTLGIFPEGTHRTRTDSGRIEGGQERGRHARGARGAPVVPVFVGRSPGPRGRLRGERLHVYVGDPITLDDSARREGTGQRPRRSCATVYALPDGARAGGESMHRLAGCRRGRAERRQELARQPHHAAPRGRGLRRAGHHARQGVQPGRVGRHGSSYSSTRAGWSPPPGSA